MNGGVNGTMEEPMETSLPSSPVSKAAVESCDDAPLENDKPEESEHTDIEPAPDRPPEDPVVQEEEQSDKMDTDPEPEPAPAQTITNVPEQEHSNNIVAENHCSNSNESCTDSVTSSQAKSEMTEAQPSHNSHTDNTKDELLVTNYSTTANHHDGGSEEEEVDSEEDSSEEEEGSEAYGEQRTEDTVSINSDSEGDETSQESQAKAKHSDVIVIENENRSESRNGNSHDSSPEVHEIESDAEEGVEPVESESNATAAADAGDAAGANKTAADNKVQLRRSSRAIKRKRYADANGDESDVEEVRLEDPLARRPRPIVVNDTKALVEMAAKHVKHNNAQKKEPTVVIIDTNSLVSSKSLSVHHNANKSTNSNALSAQNLYQSIVARGTTVTPVSAKSSSSSQSSAQAQPVILPSLTDDMFVVEAPSFIVPYVYEKPSVKPFREFVDVLGKELEEQRAKEEKEKLEKEKLEKDKREKDRQERRERGEEVSESEDDKETEAEAAKTKEEVDEEEERKKKREEKKERRRRQAEDDDVSWDGAMTSDSDEDAPSDEDKTVVIKEKADAAELRHVALAALTADKLAARPDNYFDCSLGKFFIDIGLGLVQEYVQTDLLKQQTRRLHREKRTGQNTRGTETSIASLIKNLEFSKENNAPYSFEQKKCELCSFKSESGLVMAHHMETPHMKNGVYKCNFCLVEVRSPHDILYHMEAVHAVRGKLERAPAYHQCANCPFEDNGKGKLARHLLPCAKKFKPDLNLAPPIEWEPPAKIPKITRARNNMMGGMGGARGGGASIGGVGAARGGAAGAQFRARGRSPLSLPPRGAPIHGASIIRGGVVLRHNTPAPVLMPANYPLANNGKSKSLHQPSISITPLPRQPQPAQTASQQAKSTFVICEICDGYIKDLEQLRNHMQWIHKVKIHPKMIYNRPPLNCQKCQFRFFTDQGLERHLLGTHGLVTSSMQEAANRGKDAGRCPVCGRVYQWKLLSHVAKDHNLTLKPAHLSYKCTVCTATFGMYKQFENHVYSAHSVVAKRVMDKSKPAPSNKAGSQADSLLKPLKINDEITIIPQPVKTDNKHK